MRVSPLRGTLASPMPKPPPMTLLLPFEMGEGAFNLRTLLAADPHRSWRRGYALLEQFALSGPEREFARTLLRDKTNLWLFRTNQTRYAGDFIVVDMSAPDARARRRVWVLELKANEKLKTAGGIQLTNWREALAEIAEHHGIIDANTDAELLQGDPQAVLEHLGLVKP